MYSFICQGTSTRGQQWDFFVLRDKPPPVTTTYQFNHSKVEAIKEAFKYHMTLRGGMRGCSNRQSAVIWGGEGFWPIVI